MEIRDMGVKDNIFELKLFVGGKEVAESKDVNLCLNVLAAIQRTQCKTTGSKIEDIVNEDLNSSILDVDGKDTELIAFSKMIEVDIPTLRGACDPKKEEPYMHLDMHHWADWRKSVASRGRNAVGAAALSATLMTLWFQHSGLGTPTVSQCQIVLSEIGVDDNHPSRTIRNCKWLQLRGRKTIQINPSEINNAVEVAKAFCEGRAPQLT
jgi:hypothetical protein